ncbi:MAG TPA: segregation/condensation protein A [Actinomycetota bacterium]
MAYTVRLDVFEGPFDLLLHLISKREVDIYEVSLASITEEYLQTLRQMRELDLEIATEFLVVAASLIEIKAGRLLPGPVHEEEMDEFFGRRDLLIARLLEYRAFKDAAAALGERLEANAGYFGRTSGPGREFDHVAPDLLARISLQDLAALAGTALAPKPVEHVDFSHVTPIRVTVAEAVANVLELLDDGRSLSFREITRTCTSRIDVVVRFLAVLELMKSGHASVDQAGSFGDITVTRVRSTSGAAPVVDEYEGVPAVAEEAEGGAR